MGFITQHPASLSTSVYQMLFLICHNQLHALELLTFMAYHEKKRLNNMSMMCKEATWQQFRAIVHYSVISGFHHGINEIFAVLGCYEV
jgi:hypothetical protein